MIRQTAKLKSSPNFHTIRYVKDYTHRSGCIHGQNQGMLFTSRVQVNNIGNMALGEYLPSQADCYCIFSHVYVSTRLVKGVRERMVAVLMHMRRGS